MEFEWYFRLPDFQNREEWIEIALLDFYFDPKTRSLREDRNYGCAHKDLVLGMVIVKECASNPDLLLMEYRSLAGRGPVALKWLDKSDIGRFGYALKENGVWKVKAANQVFIWRVVYDQKDRRVASVTPILEPAKLIPPSN